MKIYVDGSLVGTNTAGLEPATTTRTGHYIGKSHWDDGVLDGTIAYLRIWHGIARDQVAVTALYAKRTS